MCWYGGHFRVDDVNPALPIIRNIPYFPWSRLLKIMQDFISSTVVRPEIEALNFYYIGKGTHHAPDAQAKMQQKS